MAAGFILWWRQMPIAGMHAGAFVFGAGIIGVPSIMFSWWSDVIVEPAITASSYSRVVQLHHRYGGGTSDPVR